ncbi:tetratricopeptide repeat protein [Leptospira sp. GIMC2001]|uniref:tetratricopeptide repeat protein n=1 Tax=Leptospira sp. GIMC2001 TaxID=1513297 RepID=UPI0023493035|nr:tetratricopeptide repeat protein [Leptospira sp. GIMC2001]WCL50548.1 cyclic nucleotide-binding domain-containing protein [Leptospira sp. GIMC2001]
MAGPIIRNYKSGSIVYFEKDKAEDIYVLQKGRVILTFTSVNGNELKEDVRLGEFFGVKSALGRYPREETAQILGDASLLVFKVPEFEKFVSNKTHLIIKMLKVFSSQLRQVHRQLREILGQGEAKNPAFELMNVAEVFYKNGNYDHAAYAFQQYMKHYPDGNYAGRAKELYDSASRNAPYPINIPPLTYQGDAGSKASKLQDMLRTPAEAPKETSTANIDPNSIEGQFQKGLTLFKANQLDQAETILKPLCDREDTTTQDEEVAVEKSLFHIGLILYKKNKFDACFGSFSNYVKKYPKGSMLKEAIYHLALASEALNEKDKAKALFNKVTLLPPADDSMTSTAKTKLKALST